MPRRRGKPAPQSAEHQDGASASLPEVSTQLQPRGPAPVVIENPILNSPFEMPKRHFKFNDDGITDEIETRGRPSSYLVPIASPKKKGKQLTFDTLWTQDRAKENDDINFTRSRVSLWRDRAYPDIT